MNMINRLFALRSSPPFDQLKDAELVLIAAAVRARRYEPGELIGQAGRPLRNLFVVVGGEVASDGGEEIPTVFGATSLLFGTSLKHPIRAGLKGATCLLIRRAHFHTILNECPGLIIGLLRNSRPVDPARAA